MSFRAVFSKTNEKIVCSEIILPILFEAHEKQDFGESQVFAHDIEAGQQNTRLVPQRQLWKDRLYFDTGM